MKRNKPGRESAKVKAALAHGRKLAKVESEKEAARKLADNARRDLEGLIRVALFSPSAERIGELVYAMNRWAELARDSERTFEAWCGVLFERCQTCGAKVKR